MAQTEYYTVKNYVFHFFYSEFQPSTDLWIAFALFKLNDVVRTKPVKPLTHLSVAYVSPHFLFKNSRSNNNAPVPN